MQYACPDQSCVTYTDRACPIKWGRPAAHGWNTCQTCLDGRTSLHPRAVITIHTKAKQQTGKTPLGHALAYAEKNNPEKKR